MSTPSEKLLAEGFFEFKRAAGDGLCWVKGCRNPRRHDRCLCHKHEMQRWRQKKRASSAFHALRHHAKARGITFTITPDYFAGLTDAFAFFDQRGGASRGETLSIDRVQAHLGYEPGNCRVVSCSENSIKSNRERYLPEHVQSMLQRNREAAQKEAQRYLEESRDDDGDELPF